MQEVRDEIAGLTVLAAGKVLERALPRKTTKR